MKPNTAAYRVLLRMLRFDWTSTGDLSIALGLQCSTVSNSLASGVAKGYVERIDEARQHPKYRITAAGRAWLASQGKVAA